MNFKRTIGIALHVQIGLKIRTVQFRSEDRQSAPQIHAGLQARPGLEAGTHFDF